MEGRGSLEAVFAFKSVGYNCAQHLLLTSAGGKMSSWPLNTGCHTLVSCKNHRTELETFYFEMWGHVLRSIPVMLPSGTSFLPDDPSTIHCLLLFHPANLCHWPSWST